MDLIVHQPPPPPQTQSQSNGGFNLNNNVSPSVLLIIIILAIIFFISGLLHLLVRFILRPPRRNHNEIDNVTALEGQLQQLFHLHDAGVDQSFIDTLPIFNYKEIIGVKDPFDCAVCLCEFEGEDKLRLLPKCSHAFHMVCIDTWLLSHSTCPICRDNLIPEFAGNSNCTPVVLVLESGSVSVRENVSERERASSVARVNSHLSCESLRMNSDLEKEKSDEIQERIDENRRIIASLGGKVVNVKLGKFKNLDDVGEGSNESNADARRCFSMGSFAYVMDENSSLQVPIRTPINQKSSKKPTLPFRVAMSECGDDSRRDFSGFDAFKIHEVQSDSGNDGKSLGGSKKESFSVSKIWLRGKKDECKMETSRRAFSFRFPVRPVDEVKPSNCDGSRRTISEIDTRGWRNGGSDVGFDEETRSCNSLDSQANPPSFARRTLLWLMGKQNKVVDSSCSSNV